MDIIEKTLLEELHKLLKHHAAHLKKLCQGNENPNEQINYNSTKFEIGQPVMVKNHACHTLNLNIYWITWYYKYLMTATSCSYHQLAKNKY